VTLTTDALILVGGYTLNVSGSSATIQSIVVNSNSFSVALASGSSLTVSSPTLQQLSSDITSDVTSNVCTGSAASISLAYSGAGTVTNVITPSATVCTTSSSGGGGGSGGGSSGGNGQIWDSGPTAPGHVNTNLTGTSTASNASPAQGSSIPALQEQAIISHTGLTLTKNHHIGDKGEDIRAFQKWLNANGFVIATTGPGSPGSETSIFGTLTFKALIKFQKSKGLPQTGYLGPLTRAALRSTAATSTEASSTVQ
jgi:hypothetical protein